MRHLVHKPWFALYGLRLKRRKSGDDAGESDEEEEEISPLILLPRDILWQILFSCDPYTLGNAACACKHLLESVQVITERTNLEFLVLSKYLNQPFTSSFISH